MAKAWKLTVDEDELKALIDHHRFKDQEHAYTVEQSARLHDLTKRLNKDLEIDADPRPIVTNDGGW